MKVVVIGLGSMGKRRIRLLKQYIQEKCVASKEEWKIIGVDARADRCLEVCDLYEIKTYMDLSGALCGEALDCAFVCTSPLSHWKLIQTCLENHLHVFTELNLVSDGYDELANLAKIEKKVLFLSSTFLYRKEIQYIKEKIQERKFNGGYRYHIGQYLPEWHPWEDYKGFFVGQKRTNACREILAIELPWLIDIFGNVKSVKVLHKKASQLEIDFDDIYQILLEHENDTIGNITADVVSPRTGRDLEVWEENFYLEWKGTPETLKSYNLKTKKMEKIDLYETVEHLEGYSQFVIENAYYDEIVDFFSLIQKKGVSRYTFEKDKRTLLLVDRIEA